MLRHTSNLRRARMNIHKNARTTPLGRERIVDRVMSGQRPEAVARAAGVCPRTIRKWLAREAGLGEATLLGRPSGGGRRREPQASARGPSASGWRGRPAWMTRPYSEDLRERALLMAGRGQTIR